MCHLDQVLYNVVTETDTAYEEEIKKIEDTIPKDAATIPKDAATNVAAVENAENGIDSWVFS